MDGKHLGAVALLRNTLAPVPDGEVPPNPTRLLTTVVHQRLYREVSQAAGGVVYFPSIGPEAMMFLSRGSAGAGAPMGNLTDWSQVVGTTSLEGDLYVPLYNEPSLKLTPDLSEDFSQTRLASFALNFISDTTSTTSAALSGTFSATKVNDIRGMLSLDPAKLATQSITKKDFITGAPVWGGMTWVLGPDVTDRFTAADPLFEEVYGGEALGAWSSQINTAIGPVVFGISHYDEVSTSLTTGSSTTTIVNLRDSLSSPADGVDVEVALVSTFGSSIDTIVSATSVWAYIDSSGNYATREYNQTKLIQAMYADSTGKAAVTKVLLKNLDGLDANFTSPKFGVGWHVSTVVQVGNLKNGTMNAMVRTRAPNVYESGRLTAYVGRWDNVAAGQSLRVTGEFLTEVVCSNTVAPYVKPAKLATVNSDVMQYLSVLFNGPDALYKRVYSGQEYKVAIASVREVDDLGETTSHVDPTDAKQAQAAGIFSTIASFAKPILGTTWGNIAGLAGGLADQLTGQAAGRYHAAATGHFRSQSRDLTGY